MTREICKACNRPNPLGFEVPDDVWAAAVPEHLRNGALCIVCFDVFATENGIDWTATRFLTWAVSGTAHLRDSVMS